MQGAGIGFPFRGMSFRFWRRVRIAPGLTLNLSKSGASLSLGPRGAKFTVGPRGTRATVGIPGTGLFYTTTLSGRSSRRAGRRSRGPAPPPAPRVRPEDRLTMGFFKRLITPDDEEALVDGCRELALGHETRALAHLRKATHLADGAYLAGVLALKSGSYGEAAEWLETARRQRGRLGRYFRKYGITATVSLPITEEVAVHVGPNERGVLLALVEAYQGLGRYGAAIECLERLRRLEPEDVVIRLSLAELLWESAGEDRAACRRIVRLAHGVENETPVHAALLLYQARALRSLGLLEAARDLLSRTLRRKAGRSEELLRALRFERALVYEALGEERRARREFEKLYAEDPNDADVARKLGL